MAYTRFKILSAILISKSALATTKEQSAAEAVSTTLTGTTEFVDDSSVRYATRSKYIYSDLSVHPEASQQNLTEWLKKPLEIANFNWLTTDTTNSELFTYDLSTLQNEAYFNQKLNGFALMRGKIKLRVQVNAQPFQAGRLLLHFIPFKVHHQAQQTITRNYDLTTKTQQPCVEIDCRDTSCELEIPYISPSSWYGRENGLFDWGTIYLSVLSPLVTGPLGSTSVDVTIWANYEDLEIAAPARPQSSRMGSARPVKSKKGNLRKEKQDMNTGPISQALSTVSQVATAVEHIPMLSSIAGPVAWVSNAAASVASYFGWSKPNNETPTQLVITRSMANAVNCDGLNNAQGLGVSAVNELAISNDFAGTDIDEMNLNFINSIPAYIDSRPWSISNNTGDTLYLVRVSPSMIYRETTVTKGTATHEILTMPPFCYAANAFQLYRGGITFHIKIVKTDYHSGRLIIAFNPEPTYLSAITNGESIAVLREIVDIRESSEYTFTCPYLRETSYINVEEYIGTLSINVLNELRHTESVSSSIAVQVWCSAAPDFELAVPRAVLQRVPVVPQMDNSVDAKTKGVETGIGSSTIATRDNANAANCVGEAVVSIKQLLTRQMPFYTGETVTTGLTLFPHCVETYYLKDSAVGCDNPGLGGDPMSYFGVGYALMRGSVNISVETNEPDFRVLGYLSPERFTGSNLSTSSGAFPTITTNVTTAATADVAMLPYYANTPNAENKFNVRVPFYSGCRSMMVNFGTYNTHSQLPDSSRSTLRLASGTKNFNANNVVVRRSVADDFQFGYFVGFPPLYLATPE